MSTLFGVREISSPELPSIGSSIYSDVPILARDRAIEVVMASGVDSNTLEHSKRVEDCALRVGRIVLPSRAERLALSPIAIVHDAGKICMPDLVKLDRRFTDEEFERMKEHPEMSASLILAFGSKCLDTAEFIDTPFADYFTLLAAAVSRKHHDVEIYGSRGYPGAQPMDDFLQSKIGFLSDDPLVVRLATVIAAADNFDALSVERAYSAARLKDETGKSFVRSLDEILTLIERNFEGLDQETKTTILNALNVVGGQILDERAALAEHQFTNRSDNTHAATQEALDDDSEVASSEKVTRELLSVPRRFLRRIERDFEVGSRPVPQIA